MQILADLEGDGATAETPSVAAEKNDIYHQYKAEQELGITWGDLLRNRTGKSGAGTLRRFMLGLGTQIIVQLSGVNATSYYLPIVLEQSLGMEEKKARLLTAANGIHYTFFSFLGMMLIDKWGRRGAMLFGKLSFIRRTLSKADLRYIGSSGCACCYLCLTVIIWKLQVGGGDTDALGAAAVSMVYIYYAFFGTGWQGTAWLYNTEINSLHMRMKGASASVAAQWAVNYMVVQITPIGIQNLQWKFYLIWVFFNWLSIPILYIFYPETSNRKLEDMDQLFHDGLRPLVFLDKEATSVRRPQRYVARDQEEMAIASGFKGKNDLSGGIEAKHLESI